MPSDNTPEGTFGRHVGEGIIREARFLRGTIKTAEIEIRIRQEEMEGWMFQLSAAQRKYASIRDFLDKHYNGWDSE